MDPPGKHVRVASARALSVSMLAVSCVAVSWQPGCRVASEYQCQLIMVLWAPPDEVCQHPGCDGLHGPLTMTEGTHCPGLCCVVPVKSAATLTPAAWYLVPTPPR